MGKNSEIRRRTAPNVFHVELATPQVLEFRAEGIIERREVERALERAKALLAQHPEVGAALWDLTALEGYDPSGVMIGINWSRERAQVLVVSAMVTRSPTLAGLTQVSRVLLPSVESRPFARREEALAFLTQHLRQRRGHAA